VLKKSLQVVPHFGLQLEPFQILLTDKAPFRIGIHYRPSYFYRRFSPLTFLYRMVRMPTFKQGLEREKGREI